MLSVAFVFEIVGMLCHKTFQAVAVDVIHTDVRSALVFIVGKITHDVGMLQLDAHLKLLAEQINVGLGGSHVGLGPLDTIHTVVLDKAVAVAGATAVEKYFVLFVLCRGDVIGVAHQDASLMNSSVSPFCRPAT